MMDGQIAIIATLITTLGVMTCIATLSILHSKSKQVLKEYRTLQETTKKSIDRRKIDMPFFGIPKEPILLVNLPEDTIALELVFHKKSYAIARLALNNNNIKIETFITHCEEEGKYQLLVPTNIGNIGKVRL